MDQDDDARTERGERCLLCRRPLNGRKMSDEGTCTECSAVQVERRPNGWAIFLHPIGGGDPSGYVYFLDDGRSFVLPRIAFRSDAAH